MSLKLNSSGGGSVTLQEPSTASNRTLTLPDNTGNLISSADSGTVAPAMLSTGAPSWDSSGNLSFNSGYGSVATAYACRAWVLITVSSGTPAVTQSGNVSSITDHGTGNYTINFTTALSDANYSSFGSCRPASGGSPHYLYYVENKDNVTRSTTALRIYFLNPTVQLAQDPEIASISIVR